MLRQRASFWSLGTPIWVLERVKRKRAGILGEPLSGIWYRGLMGLPSHKVTPRGLETPWSGR